MLYTKPCARVGCTGLVWGPSPSKLARKRYCGRACSTDLSDADLQRLLRRQQWASEPAPEVVPSPKNDVTHKRIQVEQLRLIREYLAAHARPARKAISA